MNAHMHTHTYAVCLAAFSLVDKAVMPPHAVGILEDLVANAAARLGLQFLCKEHLELLLQL